MANSDRAEVKATEKAADLVKQVNAVAAQLRRVTQWLEGAFGMDLDGDGVIGDGKSGKARVGVLVAVFAIAAAGIVYAESIKHEMFTEGTYGTAYFGGDSSTLQGSLTVDDLVAEDDLTVGDDASVGGDLTVTGTIGGTPSAGSVNGSTVSATESYGQTVKTVLVLADTPIVVTGAGTNGCGSVKVYDFPEGRILVHGVTVDSLIVSVDTNSLDAADGGDWAFGTVAADTNGTLTSTEVDLCPSTSADAINTTNSAALAASAQFDGTTTAKDVYLNMLIDVGDISTSTATNTVDATVTITWINLGDY